MTAGVQNFEPAAYLPPSSSFSPQDTKEAGSSAAKTTDASGQPQDFQSELQMQDTGAPESKPTAPPKSDSGKSGKKRIERTQDPDLTVATPVQAADPSKQILPLILTFGTPGDQSTDDAKANGQASPEDKQTSVLPAGQDLPQPVTAGMKIAEEPTISPVVQNSSKTEDSSTKSAKPDALPLPAVHPEPVATAIQETVDSAPSSPAALAFAARLAASSQKGESSPAAPSPAAPSSSAQSTPANQSQNPAVTGSQPDRIPVRYAATAQILQNTADRKQGDGPKKDADSIDRLFRADARIDPQATMRTDAVARVTASSDASGDAPPNSNNPAPPQPTPSARLEHAMESGTEPPAAPPTSPNDIRVHVPDTKGGSTQVRFVESGGEVRVSVRTADEGLAQNLRTHLNDLTQRLADGGIPSEMWKPSSTASSQNNQQQPDRDGRGSGGPGSGGNENNGEQSSEQQGRRNQRPAWLEEMETSLHGSSK